MSIEPIDRARVRDIAERMRNGEDITDEETEYVREAWALIVAQWDRLFDQFVSCIQPLWQGIVEAIDGAHGQLTRIAAEAGYDSLNEFTKAIEAGELEGDER